MIAETGTASAALRLPSSHVALEELIVAVSLAKTPLQLAVGAALLLTLGGRPFRSERGYRGRRGRHRAS